MRRLLPGCWWSLIAQPARAQLSVYDPGQHGTQHDLGHSRVPAPTEQAQHAKLWAMARRLSAFTPICAATPSWTRLAGAHMAGTSYANGINDALISGTRGRHTRREPPSTERAGCSRRRLSPTAQRAFASRLATVEFADAAAISAINDTGTLRLNGRRQEPGDRRAGGAGY